METYNKIATNQIILKSNFVLTPMQKINARVKAKYRFDNVGTSFMLNSDDLYRIYLNDFGIEWITQSYDEQHKDLLKMTGSYKLSAIEQYKKYVNEIYI